MLLEDPWASLADADPLDAIRRSGKSVFAAPTEDSECQACQWRTACAGGCPLMRGTPNNAHYCQVYQILLPELVRLEARRLIAAHASQPSFSQ
jgi:sulfatase maturation enzyme AslB (radical SAM superfamily)